MSSLCEGYEIFTPEHVAELCGDQCSQEFLQDIREDLWRCLLRSQIGLFLRVPPESLSTAQDPSINQERLRLVAGRGAACPRSSPDTCINQGGSWLSAGRSADCPRVAQIVGVPSPTAPTTTTASFGSTSSAPKVPQVIGSTTPASPFGTGFVMSSAVMHVAQLASQHCSPPVNNEERVVFSKKPVTKAVILGYTQQLKIELVQIVEGLS